MKDDAGEAEDERLRGFLLKHIVTVLGRLLHREVPPVSRYMLRKLPKSVLYKHLVFPLLCMYDMLLLRVFQSCDEG